MKAFVLSSMSGLTSPNKTRASVIRVVIAHSLVEAARRLGRDLHPSPATIKSFVRSSHNEHLLTGSTEEQIWYLTETEMEGYYS